jgi:hypothetical protein
MTNTVFQRFKDNISSISHLQATAEHWDLPYTEIFQSKDIASGKNYMMNNIMNIRCLWEICDNLMRF